jgi:hypothetical protein
MKSKSEVLAKLVSKSGVQRTLDITGYDILELFMALEDKVKIDFDIALKLIFELRGNTYLLHDKIGFAKLRFSEFEGIIHWTLNPPGENMDAMCTPFWDASPNIPIETIEYSYIDEDNKTHSVYDTFNDNITLYTLEPFNSVSELVHWFNTTYLNEVYDHLLVYLRDYREEYKR